MLFQTVFYVVNVFLLEGRVVKKPSWADVYTEHNTLTETEDDEQWTPDRPKKSTDDFKPRKLPIVTSGTKAHSM